MLTCIHQPCSAINCLTQRILHGVIKFFPLGKQRIFTVVARPELTFEVFFIRHDLVRPPCALKLLLKESTALSQGGLNWRRYRMTTRWQMLARTMEPSKVHASADGPSAARAHQSGVDFHGWQRSTID